MYPMSSRPDRVLWFLRRGALRAGIHAPSIHAMPEHAYAGSDAPGVRMRREYVPQPGDACAGVRMRREYACAPEYIRRAPGA
jgi:hypothetical protein